MKVKNNTIPFHTKIASMVSEEGKNFAISPLSIAMAFEMVKLVASEKTLEEIKEVFGDIPKINIPKDFNLQIANSVWTTEDASEDYISLVKEKLNAEAKLIQNFNGQPINEWCSEKTNGLIDSIVDRNLDKNVSAVLINVIYFLADWLNKFNKKDTTENGNFTLFDGSKIKVPMMRKFNGNHKYYEQDGVKYVSLPYSCKDNKKPDTADKEGFSPSMILAIPPEGKSVADFISKWNPLESSFYCYEKDFSILAFPRFKFKWGAELITFLKKLGLLEIFTDNSKVNGILASGNHLKIGAVAHKTVVKVDENGTEAAAVTALQFLCCAAMNKPDTKVIFVADRPFAFSIVEMNSSAVLFTGAVYDPRKED